MTASNIKLSIIIPVYNGEEYLRRIVYEIISHNTKLENSYEILLIDDGSSDDSHEICMEIAEELEQMYCFRKENGGIASARNYGLKRARGKYVTFADQDDSIVKGYKEFLDICEAESLDILITSPYCSRRDNERIEQRRFQSELVIDKNCINTIAGKLIDDKYLSTTSAQSVSASVWNSIYRRQMLVKNSIKFKSFIDYEDDWIFNIEALLSSQCIGISEKGYYCWQIHDNSESHKKKYIDNLLEKRSNWLKWLENVLYKMDISDNRKNEFFSRVITPRNIIMCFNNACWRPDIKKKDIMNEIEEACEFWRAQRVNVRKVDQMDIWNKLLLILLKHGCYNSAYSINRKVLKKRFH